MKELFIDRLERLNVEYNIVGETEDGYWYNFCKKGNMSWARAIYERNPFTELRTCDLCGKTSTPKKVQYRSLCIRWNVDDKKHDFETRGKDTLCMGCWNKVRIVVKRQNEVETNRRLINKLNRERLKWQKSQTQAN